MRNSSFGLPVVDSMVAAVQTWSGRACDECKLSFWLAKNVRRFWSRAKNGSQIELAYVFECIGALASV